MLAADGLLKAPLKLIGAKTGIKKDSPRSRCYALFPSSYSTYVEPFIGSGSVLIGKPLVSRELASDINPWPIHFYRTLQAAPDALFEMIQVYCADMTKERFDRLRFDAPDRLTHPLTAAAWYYAINKFARNGIVRFRKRDGKCNSTFGEETTGRGLLNREWLVALTMRIRHVEFQREDYKEALERAERVGDAFVFLDPPYSRVFTEYNGGDRFTDDDHVEMADILKRGQFRFLLTINDNDFIRDLYEGFRITSNPVHWQCSNTPNGRGTREELIIRNY